MGALHHTGQTEHVQSYNELIYTRRRFIHQEHLRAAIIDVAYAIFQVRQPHIWGEGTTTCASDSTRRRMELRGVSPHLISTLR